MQQGCQEPPARRGITLLEVLVVVAIAGLLMALLLGAVQQARSTSHRLDCSSRLRQAWLGMEQYQLAFGNYPTQFLHPYAYFIRPYIGAEGVNGSSQGFQLLRCPSDPWATGLTSPFTQISYLPSDGVRGDLRGERGIVGDHDDLSLVRRPRDIVDGLSNTAAMAERLALPEYTQAYWMLPESEWIRLQRTTAVHHESLRDFSDECILRPGDPHQQGVPVRHYNHIVPPNGNSCANGHLQGYASSFTATSLHRGGVNLSMADGALRFVSNSINREIWWAIGTIDGGEAHHEF